MNRLIDLPKALLPVWLVVLLVVGGTLAGAVATRLGAPVVAGAGVAAALAWGGALVARRVLAARGHEGLDELPATDDDDGAGAEFVSRTLYALGPFAIGAAVGGLVQATGVGATGNVWDIPGWLVIAVIASFPAVSEIDVRYGLRLHRRREGEEDAIRSESADAPAGAPAVPTAPVPTAAAPLARPLAPRADRRSALGDTRGTPPRPAHEGRGGRGHAPVLAMAGASGRRGGAAGRRHGGRRLPRVASASWSPCSPSSPSSRSRASRSPIRTRATQR